MNNFYEFPKLLILYFIIVIIGIIGWISNVVYIFTHIELTARWILALVGAFVVPLGAIHGIILFFI